MISRWIRFRIFLLGVLMTAAAIKIGQRAIELQVDRSEELRARAEDQHLRSIELRPQRGRILDRSGNELASSALFDSISCNPRQLLAVKGGVERLGRALDMNPRKLARSLEGRRYFAWVKRTVSPEISARVKALALPGVHLNPEPKRVYPHGEVGAGVLGFANIDGTGVEGVERSFDQLLRGHSIEMQTVLDGRGRHLLVDGLIDRQRTAGKDVVLTLDQYLMHVTHEALAAGVKEHNAKSGTAVIMDPRTGELLAMASVPSYDPTRPAEAVRKGYTKNRVITDIYEPGSTLKAMTFAAVIDAGLLEPEEIIDCQSGRPLFIGRERIHDDHPVGVVTAAEVLQKSSNIGTVKIVRRLGKQGLYDALLRFGFGQPSGIPLIGEVRGIVRPARRWREIAFANIAFGQGLAVTPLQITAAFASLSNGGMYKAPRIIQAVIHPDGRREELPPDPQARPEHRVVSEKTAATLMRILEGVVGRSGTARLATVDGYRIAGKTGTAQKVVGGKYAAWVGSFIGIVPANDPQFVISVILDEPEPLHKGGKVAAPIFAAIAKAALQYKVVPPTEPIPTKPAAGPKPDVPPLVSDGVGEEPLGASPGSEPPLWVDPDALAEPVELFEEEVLADAQRLMAEAEPIPADQVAVPSFAGMTMGEAIRVAREAGLTLVPEGSGVAVAQSPAPGQQPKGAVCRVSFRPGG